MKEKTVPSLKNFATATSVIARLVDLTFEGLSAKAALIKILFQIWG